MGNKKNIRMLTDKAYNAILTNTTSLLELAILSLIGLGTMRISEVVAMLAEEYNQTSGVWTKKMSTNPNGSIRFYPSVRSNLNMYIQTDRDRIVKEAASEGRPVPEEMFIYKAKDGQIRPVNRRYIETLFHRALEHAGIDRDAVALSDLRRYGLCVGLICNAFFGTLSQSDVKKYVRYIIGETEKNEYERR